MLNTLESRITPEEIFGNEFLEKQITENLTGVVYKTAQQLRFVDKEAVNRLRQELGFDFDWEILKQVGPAGLLQIEQASIDLIRPYSNLPLVASVDFSSLLEINIALTSSETMTPVCARLGSLENGLRLVFLEKRLVGNKYRTQSHFRWAFPDREIDPADTAFNHYPELDIRFPYPDGRTFWTFAGRAL